MDSTKKKLWASIGGNLVTLSLIAALWTAALQECPKCPECPPVYPPSPAVLVGDFYVHPDGNDNNRGKSWGDPFETISRGIDALSNGDTLIVAKGTYFEKAIIEQAKDVVIIAEDGTCIDCIGQSVHRTTGCVIVGTDNSEFINFEVKNSEASGIIIASCDSGKVLNCKTNNNRIFGLTAWNATNFDMSYNDVYANGKMYLENGDIKLTHGVYIRRGCDGFKFTFNNVYGNATSSLHVNGQVGEYYSNCVVTDNFFFNNGAGFNFMNIYDGEFSRNIVFNDRLSVATANSSVEFTFDDGATGDRSKALGSDRFKCLDNIIVNGINCDGIEVDRGQHNGVTKDGMISGGIIVVKDGKKFIDDKGTDTLVNIETITLGRWNRNDMTRIFAGGNTLFDNPTIPVNEDGYCEDIETWKGYFKWQ